MQIADFERNSHWRQSVLQWRQAHSGLILAIHSCHFVGGWMAMTCLGSSKTIPGGTQPVARQSLSQGRPLCPCDAPMTGVGGVGGSPFVISSFTATSHKTPHTFLTSQVLGGGQYNSESRIDFTPRAPYPLLARSL